MRGLSCGSAWCRRSSISSVSAWAEQDEACLSAVLGQVTACGKWPAQLWVLSWKRCLCVESPDGQHDACVLESAHNTENTRVSHQTHSTDTLGKKSGRQNLLTRKRLIFLWLTLTCYVTCHVLCVCVFSCSFVLSTMKWDFIDVIVFVWIAKVWLAQVKGYGEVDSCDWTGGCLWWDWAVWCIMGNGVWWDCSFFGCGCLLLLTWEGRY